MKTRLTVPRKHMVSRPTSLSPLSESNRYTADIPVTSGLSMHCRRWHSATPKPPIRPHGNASSGKNWKICCCLQKKPERIRQTCMAPMPVQSVTRNSCLAASVNSLSILTEMAPSIWKILLSTPSAASPIFSSAMDGKPVCRSFSRYRHNTAAPYRHPCLIKDWPPHYPFRSLKTAASSLKRTYRTIFHSV